MKNIKTERRFVVCILLLACVTMIAFRSAMASAIPYGSETVTINRNNPEFREGL